MTTYWKKGKRPDTLRLPLEGNIDITYRCNLNCRHCWIRISPNDEREKDELSLEEIRRIVDEARAMGCRKWHLSGGEPILRPDFPELFEYITKKARHYSLNTNGTRITPKIARLLKKKGTLMVSLYGVTPDIHDHITRVPGAFESTMQGIAYLREAGTPFILQIVPMRDNYHQFQDMVQLAGAMGVQCRVGASWLYLSAYGDEGKNREIRAQRLDPQAFIAVNQPISFEETPDRAVAETVRSPDGEHLFPSCIRLKNGFHVDPYGGMSFCQYIHHSDFRFNLKNGCFLEGWETFIPSLAEKVPIDRVYLENCRACKLRADCLWCPAYGYLEHKNFSSKVEYLCSLAKESMRHKKAWIKMHRRFYKIAGLTIQLESDREITDSSFHPKLKQFETTGPGSDNVVIQHHFYLPKIHGQNLGKKIYHHAPWAIYRKNHSWVYLGFSPDGENDEIYRIAVFNNDHTRAQIYSDNIDEDTFRRGELGSFTFFSTDQIVLARILADRNACYLHAAGVDFDGKGLLFVGHSDSGKSTLSGMLKDRAKILCDDRMILRKWDDGLQIHGTWHHGDIPTISADAAPLKAILFLEQSSENSIRPMKDKQEILQNLLACWIKPLASLDWWQKTLDFAEQLVKTAPFYRLRFDKSDRFIELLEKL